MDSNWWFDIITLVIFMLVIVSMRTPLDPSSRILQRVKALEIKLLELELSQASLEGGWTRIRTGVEDH